MTTPDEVMREVPEITKDLDRERAEAYAELCEASGALLAEVDGIHPPLGLFWSGAPKQEHLRAALARVRALP